MLELQDNVEAPDPPTMLPKPRLQVRLVELVVVARVTVPLKPFNVATVIVEVLVIPTFAVRLVGLPVTV